MKVLRYQNQIFLKTKQGLKKSKSKLFTRETLSLVRPVLVPAQHCLLRAAVYLGHLAVAVVEA